MKYFAYDNINGNFEIFLTEDEAKAQAREYLQYYENHSCDDGWPENMEGNIGYGPITTTTKYTIIADRKDYTDEEWAEECYSDDFDHIASCELMERIDL